MTITETVDAVALPLLEFGRGWMMAPATAAAGAELGFEGFGFWVNGRAGVLGDVDADVAAAAIGFMDPATVRAQWEARAPEVSPRSAAEAYAAAAAEWGRTALADVSTDELEELLALARRVVAGAPPSIGVLFAGWRHLAVPADPAGAVTMVLNVLRELRGGAHLAAVHAAGLGPLGAIVSFADSVRGGHAGAERFGWQRPFPDVDAAARAAAEAMTTTIVTPAYAVLDERERERMVELVRVVHAAPNG